MSDLGWFLQPAVFPWLALGLGLCVGSFLNVVIHRLPKMMERDWRADCAELAAGDRPVAAPAAEPAYNLVTPRSACPGCGRAIRAHENVPVFSWLALRGRCAGCGVRISARYPLVELLAGTGAAWSAAHFGFGAAALGATLFLWCTIALAFIDHETGYLPDDITLPLLWAGLLLNIPGTFAPLPEAVIGAAAGYLALWAINAAFRLVRGIDGMGYGDFKMTAAVGAFVGWKYLFLVILLSSCVGLAFGLAQMIAARRGWDAAFRFHFGPCIAIAGVAALLWGPAILAVIPALRPF
ncbi:MAG: prepilin peptidase [Burkholderiales bacterium]|nr:prepilin peptidase [Burkholderiales bacterium]